MRKKIQKPFSYKNYGKDLEHIIRFHKFAIMFYRTNNYIHTQRIIAILRKFKNQILEIFPDIDFEKLLLLVKFHDAHEIIDGDISLQAKLLMSEEELLYLSEREVLTIDHLSNCYPKSIKGYNLKELMLEAKLKNTVISQLASFVDKVDGFCEALHELLAGNVTFAEPVYNYALETFSNIENKYPLLKPIINSDNNVFFKKHVGCLQDYFKNGTVQACPHTVETVKRKTGFTYYEIWKEVTIKTFGVDVLIVKKEPKINVNA